MDFTLDTEQQALREAVAGLLKDTYPDIGARRAATADEPGFDEKQWRRLAEMGVLGLPFGEDVGGMDAGPIEVGLVAEELGRVVAPEPFVQVVVLAGGLVDAAGTDEQRAELLGPLVEGDSLIAFAHAEAGARWAATARAVTAERDGDGWVLTGVKEPVPNAARADVLLVSAATDAGTELFVVDAFDSVERTNYRTVDGGRAGRITFSRTPARVLGAGGVDRAETIALVGAQAQIAASREAVGAMERALWTTVEYLKTRKQFGVTLSTFQALTFRAADMYTRLELASSVALWASMVAADAAAGEVGADRLLEAASRARLATATAGRHIGQEAVQLHGGIAMTAEYSVGHHLARLTALDHLYGDRDHHLARLAADVRGHRVVDPFA